MPCPPPGDLPNPGIEHGIPLIDDYFGLNTAVIYIKQWPAYVFSFLCIRRQSPQYIATIYSKESFSSRSFFYFPPSRSFEEKAMATHPSTLAWKIPWKEESDRLQSMGSQRIRQD